MKRVLSSLITFLILFPSLGQSDIQRLFNQGDELMNLALYDSAVNHFYQLTQKTKLLENDSIHARALNDYAYALANISDEKGSDSVFNEAINFAQPRLGKDHITLGFLYANQSLNLASDMNFDGAINAAQKAIDIARKNENDTILALALNSMNRAVRFSGKYREALVFAWEADSIWMRNPGIETLETARTYFSLGWLYIATGDMIKSLQNHQKALRIRLKFLKDPHPTLARSYSLIGRCYEEFGQYSLALEYYEKSVGYTIASIGKEHSLVANAYKNFATISSKLGNYDKAIQYMDESIRIWTKTVGPNDMELIDSYSKLSDYYLSKSNYPQFLFYINVANTIANKVVENDHPKRLEMYGKYASYYKKTGNTSKQLEYLDKEELVIKKSFGTEHPFYGNHLLQRSAYHANIQQFQKSLIDIKESLRIHKKNYGQNHPNVAMAIAAFGDIHLKMGDPQKALEFYQEALINISDDENKLMSPNYNPPTKTVNAKLMAIDFITRKANALLKSYQRDTTQIELLKASLITNLSGIKYLDEIRNTYTTEDDKIRLFETVRRLFTNAVDAASLLYEKTGQVEYIHQAFQVSDRSKSFVLLNSINTHKAIKFANVPDSLVKLDQKLKAERSYLHRKVELAKRRKSSSTGTIKNQLFLNQQEIDALEDHLERNYSKYYDLKLRSKVASITEVQDAIQDGQMMIEYFLSKNEIFIFKLSKSSFEVFRRSLPKDFNTSISNYRKSLTDYEFIINNASEANSLFTKSSTSLYDLLLKGVLSKNDEAKSLIIIPDGEIGAINFEVLGDFSISSKKNYDKLPYLIKDYDISYCYSASFKSLHNEKLNSKTTSIQNFAGFAPSYSESSLLMDLKGARKETSLISRLLNGDEWIGSRANEKEFKENASNYKINHLAMHGAIDDLNPLNSYLAFGDTKVGEEDNKLTIDEIYGLKIDSDLVVLSACESGQGLVRGGEGNMSLSRAFNYAGSPSVVMSLWKTGDIESSQLMLQFYKGLLDGKSKANALRAAKLNYIEKAQDPLYSHPFFWAGFMLVGDEKPVSIKPASSLLFYLIVFGILFTSIYFLNKKKVFELS